jgi:hypothetical protein
MAAIGDKVADGSIRKLIGTDDGKVTCVQCGADIPLHGMHWVHEVCPQCLQCYRWGTMTDYNLYVSHGFWYGEGLKAIRQSIAKAGGRYVPSFR